MQISRKEFLHPLYLFFVLIFKKMIYMLHSLFVGMQVPNTYQLLNLLVFVRKHSAAWQCVVTPLLSRIALLASQTHQIIPYLVTPNYVLHNQNAGESWSEITTLHQFADFEIKVVPGENNTTQLTAERPGKTSRLSLPRNHSLFFFENKLFVMRHTQMEKVILYQLPSFRRLRTLHHLLIWQFMTKYSHHYTIHNRSLIIVHEGYNIIYYISLDDFTVEEVRIPRVYRSADQPNMAFEMINVTIQNDHLILRAGDCHYSHDQEFQHICVFHMGTREMKFLVGSRTRLPSCKSKLSLSNNDQVCCITYIPNQTVQLPVVPGEPRYAFPYQVTIYHDWNLVPLLETKIMVTSSESDFAYNNGWLCGVGLRRPEGTDVGAHIHLTIWKLGKESAIVYEHTLGRLRSSYMILSVESHKEHFLITCEPNYRQVKVPNTGTQRYLLLNPDF